MPVIEYDRATPVQGVNTLMRVGDDPAIDAFPELPTRPGISTKSVGWALVVAAVVANHYKHKRAEVAFAIGGLGLLALDATWWR